jgi:hypothetical protein
MQHDDCRNNAKQTEQREDWCNESKTDLIAKLVVLPKLTPVGTPARQRANGNKQNGNENQPAKADSNQPGSVAGAQGKEEADSGDAAKHCEELRPKLNGFVA